MLYQIYEVIPGPSGRAGVNGRTSMDGYQRFHNTLDTAREEAKLLYPLVQARYPNAGGIPIEVWEHRTYELEALAAHQWAESLFVDRLTSLGFTPVSNDTLRRLKTIAKDWVEGSELSNATLASNVGTLLPSLIAEIEIARGIPDYLVKLMLNYESQGDGENWSDEDAAMDMAYDALEQARQHIRVSLGMTPHGG